MNKVAARDREFRSQLFTETAAKLGLAPAIVEKDFWVCWTLKQLFGSPALAGMIIFKGGTSLSKVHRLIRRFSEDVDLTLDRRLLGFGEDNNPDSAPSGKRRKKLVKDMVAACQAYVGGPLLDLLRRQCGDILGASEHWEVQLDPEAKDRQTILFHYPATTPHPDYIPPSVKLELGSRSDSWPTAAALIQPYAAESFPQPFIEPACEVAALDVNRTFWEKATILHEEAHRPEADPLPPRYSRHYYDLAMLADSPVASSALGRIDLLDRVAWHKTTFFYRSWSDFGTAKPGSFRLLPPKQRIAPLEADYGRMLPMMFETPPPFSEILARLRALEQTINSTEKLN